MKTFFLPGAGGSRQFWKPLADELGQEGVLFSWPGLGDEAHQDGIKSIDALVDLVERNVTEPVNIVAQSMGGLVAVLLAVRKPEMINSLALFVTSAGVKMDQFGASDWRQDYRAAFPNAAMWIEDVEYNLTQKIKLLEFPVLLIWGDDDPISPVAVGKHLESLFPNATLHIVQGGDHDIGSTHARSLAPIVRDHFEKSR
jgi:pimeloyl-ACP methyl ester carboxylesterase